MMQSNSYHTPVLLDESVDGLNIKPNGIYVDATFGGGGHSKAILSKLNSDGKLIAFDTDNEARNNILNDERFTLIPENFRFIKRFLKLHNITKVDGILADLGVSSHQFNEASRGFSTRFDGILDMRMNQNTSLSAKEVINQYPEEQLINTLQTYGELKFAKKIANTIVSFRNNNTLETTNDLKKCLTRLLPRGKEHKVLAQIFQAIRIEVNQELEVLKEFLTQSQELIKTTGRLSIISYHSLEDRLVKRYMKNGLFEGEPKKDLYGNFYTPFKPVKKLITPTDEEIKQNNRARSAKLRVAEKH